MPEQTGRPVLEREVFHTSRSMEFFTVKELTIQIGHAPHLWPLALLKELIDNALDAAEGAGQPPRIEVSIRSDQRSTDRLVVRDNGPGLPIEVLRRSLDYNVRTSTKSYYASPTRGQLGNALKCVWAAPFVASDMSKGRVEVHVGGVAHSIEVRLDEISQVPNISVDEAPSAVKNGTEIHILWPGGASLLREARPDDFYRAEAETEACPLWHMLRGYAAFNPHADIILTDGDGCVNFCAGESAWSKWLPNEPTSPHWYDTNRLAGLIGAYLARERAGGQPRSVRDFVAEFRGLSSTVKRKDVTTAAGLAQCRLVDLITNDAVDLEKTERLLRSMQAVSRAVEPRMLGIIGDEHLKQCLERDFGVDSESVRYRKKLGTASGLPFVLEVAFGVKQDNEERRTILAGVNWSPLLTCPFPELYELATEMRLDSFDPLVLVVHIACPHLPFADRGKSHVHLPEDLADALAEAIRSAAKAWKVQKQRADRDDRLTHRQLEELRRIKRRGQLTVRAAAFQVMREAYLQTSDNGRLPANARQIMYVARPLVQNLLGGKCWKDSNYFTQTLLPAYSRLHPEETAGWDVVFDARGHLVEPHTQAQVGLGTLAVRRYVDDWRHKLPASIELPTLQVRVPTCGPVNRYRFALFIEKEGFDPLLERARIGNRFDVALMSTKGMSVTAARKLLEHFAEQGVVVLVLHDFDKSGFSILHTLSHDTPRYRFRHRPKVIDLGLRLADVQRMRLQQEEVQYRKVKKDPRVLLAKCGATKAEQNFLVESRSGTQWHGHRVELNAMRPAQFIQFIERKLRERGVEKIMPDAAALATAYNLTRQGLLLQRTLAERHAMMIQEQHAPLPDGLEAEIRRRLAGSDKSWDELLAECMKERDDLQLN